MKESSKSWFVFNASFLGRGQETFSRSKILTYAFVWSMPSDLYGRYSRLQNWFDSIPPSIYRAPWCVDFVACVLPCAWITWKYVRVQHTLHSFVAGCRSYGKPAVAECWTKPVYYEGFPVEWRTRTYEKRRGAFWARGRKRHWRNTLRSKSL